jgi:DNA-binding CsgD family transcriptional regulator
MLHAGQPERVFTTLDAIAHALRDEERWEAAVLRGAALVALGRLDDGIATLRPALGSGDEAVRSEARCELAEAYLRAGRLDDVETVLSLFLDREGEREPHRAARGLALYGRMERARGRRVVAGRYFLDALSALERAEEPLHRLRNALLHNVAVVAVETLEPRLFERVRARLATVDHIGPEHVAIQRVRVRGELLCGETERAWDIAFATFVSSPPGIARVRALLGLALTARAGGERFTPARLTLAATDEGDHADWAQAGAEDRLVLLRLVGALAPLGGARAGALLRVYETLPAVPQALDEAAGLALARAALAQGNRAERTMLLEHAVRSARTAGNAWAEAEAALELASDGDAAALRRADELTRPAPRSWLRRRYEALGRSLGPARLSPAERRVMDAICEGRSTADIAARFSRSKNTIRNQTRRVYEVMEVRTRSALVAKCAAAGLLPSAPSPVVSKA